MKNQSVAGLKKKLWKLFSEWVRSKDADFNGYTKCFSCGKTYPWKELDAGHYIPKSIGGANLYFHEKNVHPQCTYCNRHMHGNLSAYAARLVEKYGPDILQWLEAYKNKSVPYNGAELKILIDYYKKKLTEIK